MKDVQVRRFSIILLIISSFVIWEAGCKGQSIPVLSSPPTPNLSATANPDIFRSTTPTPVLVPIYQTSGPTPTAAPSVTPLVGSGRTITSRDTNQTIILNIGETFVMQKLPESSSLENKAYMFLKRISGSEDPTQGDQEYQAIASGSSHMDIYIGLPCPNSPMGCQPPLLYSLKVIIIGEVKATPTRTCIPYPGYP